MNEHPILFSGPMVRAILEGRKWQTRRVMKPQPTAQLYQIGATNEWAPPDPRDADVPHLACAVRCPYGAPGDRLWVREAFARLWFKADDGWQTVYRADDNLDCILEAARGNWKPSIHMPRRYSRITLEITSVRVEPIQETSLDDMRAEGIRPSNEASLLWRETLTENFKNLWDQINGERGYPWSTNPWVWVVSFKQVQP